MSCNSCSSSQVIYGGPNNRPCTPNRRQGSTVRVFNSSSSTGTVSALTNPMPVEFPLRFLDIPIGNPVIANSNGTLRVDISSVNVPHAVVEADLVYYSNPNGVISPTGIDQNNQNIYFSGLPGNSFTGSVFVTYY